MNPKLNQNAKHETQTPPKLTTAFPQAFATYLIFVQRNIFLGSLLCKYLLSKTSTCLWSCSISHTILVEGLLRCVDAQNMSIHSQSQLMVSSVQFIQARKSKVL